ncbi:hypothetical protein [Neobacillus sp. PS3-40]|uniref:hypothetical protein n=1 Tax=Neobacillus sp. PS3-40 TaxID=3070679 RepID=UPI0027E02826|nr:hypothetical protein [Neobacillus sp. PS3-40]WML46119.1 hypothetical protein RCG20_09610 [Neobacillus sp. PS3-40]
MEQLTGHEELLKQFEQSPPKIIGGYKKQGWAIKVLDKTGNEAVEVEEDGTVTAKAVLESSDNSYYPAFIHIDVKQKGQIVGVYFISEKKDQFDLIPFELAKEFIEKEEKDLIPFKYRTLEKIENDEFQKNWPEFS